MAALFGFAVIVTIALVAGPRVLVALVFLAPFIYQLLKAVGVL